MRLYAVTDRETSTRYYKTKAESLRGFRAACKDVDDAAEWSEGRYTVELCVVNVATDKDSLLDILNGNGGYITDETLITQYCTKAK